MATKRAQRLARAIENLSGRDLHLLVSRLGDGHMASTKLDLQVRLLRYAEQHAAPPKDIPGGSA